MKEMLLKHNLYINVRSSEISIYQIHVYVHRDVYSLSLGWTIMIQSHTGKYFSHRLLAVMPLSTLRLLQSLNDRCFYTYYNLILAICHEFMTRSEPRSHIYIYMCFPISVHITDMASHLLVSYLDNLMERSFKHAKV